MSMPRPGGGGAMFCADGADELQKFCGGIAKVLPEIRNKKPQNFTTKNAKFRKTWR